jgi:hypothetical protein
MKSGQPMVRLIAGAVMAVGTAGAILALAGVDVPARVPAVLLFLAAAPAIAVASLLPRLDVLGKVVVAGTAAVVVNAAVASVMLLAGVWSPRAGLLIVALVSAVLAASRLLPRLTARSA